MIVFAFFIGLLFSIPLGPLGQIILERSIGQEFWQVLPIVIINLSAH